MPHAVPGVRYAQEVMRVVQMLLGASRRLLTRSENTVTNFSGMRCLKLAALRIRNADQTQSGPAAIF